MCRAAQIHQVCIIVLLWQHIQHSGQRRVASIHPGGTHPGPHLEFTCFQAPSAAHRTILMMHLLFEIAASVLLCCACTGRKWNAWLRVLLSRQVLLLNLLYNISQIAIPWCARLAGCCEPSHAGSSAASREADLSDGEPDVQGHHGRVLPGEAEALERQVPGPLHVGPSPLLRGCRALLCMANEQLI